MYAGRIYADFQNLDDDNRVRLDTAGTVRDLAERELTPGEWILLYTDDADDEGKPDPLFAEGRIEVGSDGKPAVRIDWAGTRHASDEVYILRKRFFDTAIGDVLRALEGRSLIGATALALCALDHVGYLMTGRGEPSDFERVVELHLTKLNVGYDAKWLWDVRNGLVHVHGQSKRMVAGQQPVGVAFVHLRPDLHLTPQTAGQGNTKVLNVDSLITDVIIAAWTAFEDFCNTPEIPLSAFPSLLIVYQSDANADKPYVKMHPCLDPLDSPTLDRQAILAQVQQMLKESSPQAA